MIDFPELIQWGNLTIKIDFSLENKCSNISFSSRFLASLCHSFAHFFSGIFGKKNEGEKIPPICCMHWFWLKKYFFFQCLGPQIWGAEGLQSKSGNIQANDLVAKGAKGSIWAKTTLKDHHVCSMHWHWLKRYSLKLTRNVFWQKQFAT